MAAGSRQCAVVRWQSMDDSRQSVNSRQQSAVNSRQSAFSIQRSAVCCLQMVQSSTFDYIISNCELMVTKSDQHLSISRSFSMLPINDGLWHHIFVSWENIDGRWDFLVDGVLISYEGAWGKSQTISPGKLVVGQHQKEYGGGYLIEESFIGKIASFNMWDRKMNNNDLEKKSTSCNQELGNVIDWRMFRHGIHGSATIISLQSSFCNG